jgi:hypothetical protein
VWCGLLRFYAVSGVAPVSAGLIGVTAVPRGPGRSRLPYEGSAVTKQMRFILEKLAKALKADGTAMDDVARSPSRFHLCHHRLRLG